MWSLQASFFFKTISQDFCEAYASKTAEPANVSRTDSEPFHSRRIERCQDKVTFLSYIMTAKMNHITAT